MAVYCASKAYVQSFSQAIASERKGKGGCGHRALLLVLGALREWSTHMVLHDCETSIAADVARFGYEAQSGKTVAIYGVRNKILTFSTRLAPRKILLAIPGC